MSDTALPRRRPPRPARSAGNVEHPRLWGIDAIAGLYAVATLLMVWLFFTGSVVGFIAAIILAPLCGWLSLGIYRRSNAARIVLLTLLGISLVGNVFTMAYLLAGILDVVTVPPNKNPVEELIKMPFKFGAAILMFLYLLRRDVRTAFRRDDVTDERLMIEDE